MTAAKDIDEERLLAFIREINNTGRWAFTWDLHEEFPEYPPKVLRAKCRALISQKKLNGCACGCRGDFYIERGWD